MTGKDWRNRLRAREGYWFVPKMFGLGATPVTWQGWLLTLGLVGGLIADVRLMPNHTAKIVVGLVLLLIFLPIMIARTDGGWRWRWGVSD